MVPQSPARRRISVGVVRQRRGSSETPTAAGWSGTSWFRRRPSAITPATRSCVRRCADLALELKRYHDAHRHLNSLLETGQATGAAAGRVGRLAGPVRERDDPI